MIPNIASLINTATEVAIPIPTKSVLFEIKRKEDIKALTNRASRTYKARNCIPVPIFLLTAVSEAISEEAGDSYTVLLRCAAKMKSVDSNHADNEFFLKKSHKTSKYILVWLFLVTRDIIKKIETKTLRTKVSVSLWIL